MNPHIRISNEAGHTMFELDAAIVRKKLAPVGLVELMLHLHRANAVVNTTSLALLPLDAVYSGAWQEEHAGRSSVADVQWRFEERLQAAADQSGPLAVVMGEVNEGIAYQVLAACFGTPSALVHPLLWWAFARADSLSPASVKMGEHCSHWNSHASAFNH